MTPCVILYDKEKKTRLPIVAGFFGNRKNLNNREEKRSEWYDSRAVRRCGDFCALGLSQDHDLDGQTAAPEVHRQKVPQMRRPGTKHSIRGTAGWALFASLQQPAGGTQRQEIRLVAKTCGRECLPASSLPSPVQKKFWTDEGKRLSKEKNLEIRGRRKTVANRDKDKGRLRLTASASQRRKKEMKAPISIGDLFLPTLLIAIFIIVLWMIKSKPKPRRQGKKEIPLWKRIVLDDYADKWSGPVVLPVSGESEHPFWSWVSRSLGGRHEETRPQEEYQRAGLSRKDLERIARETLEEERACQPQQRKQQSRQQPPPPEQPGSKKPREVRCAKCHQMARQVYYPNSLSQLKRKDRKYLNKPLCNWCWGDQPAHKRR